MNIAVLGAGAWGTSIASLLAKKNYSVKIWANEPEVINSINTVHRNDLYLPEFDLPENLIAVDDFSELTKDVEIIVNAVPSKFTRSIIQKIKPFIDKPLTVVTLSKGLEPETYKRISEVITEELGTEHEVVALSGPNIAWEVAKEIPSKTVIGHSSKHCLVKVKEILETEYFRVYCNDDIIGVELGGALKNIIAVAAGFCDGLGYGVNTKSAIISRGLNEMASVGKYFGAKPITFMGLSGVGDLIVTAMSEHGRNRFFGQELGKGLSVDEIINGLNGKVVEAMNIVPSVYKLNEKMKLDLPITEQVYRVLYEKLSAKEAFDNIWKIKNLQDVCH